MERGADLGVGEDDADVEVSGESGEVGGLPSLGMRKGDEAESDTVDSVQSDADVRTLLGPPISIRNSTANGDSSTITPAIKTDGNISINCVPPTTPTNPPQPINIFSQSQSSYSISSITATTQSLPPTSTLLLTPPPSKYPPSQYELFESHLQLRMTQGTVVEIVEGAEGAEALWLEVFGWVAKRRSAGDGLQRQSIDGSSHHHTITTSIDGLQSNPNSNPIAHHHNQQQQQTRLDIQKSRKNVGQLLKGSVMKSRAGITAATKKLGARHGGLRRSTSTPGSFWLF